MDEEELIFEQIDRYVQGEMEEEEQAAFEQRMQTDEALAGEVAMQQDLMGHIADDKKKALRQELKNLFSDEAAESAPVKVRQLNVRKLLMAASIALLAGMSYWLYQTQQNTSEKLFASHFEVYVIQERSSGNTNNYEQAKAEAFYQQGNYAEALELFNNLPQTPSVLFYQGNCYLVLEQVPQAIEAFDKVIAEKDSPLVFEARWYKTLAHIKQNKKAAAKAVLQEALSSPRLTEAERKKASALLEKL